ncbi:glycoside hydrolase [Microbacterium sp. NPDC089695]|uniref:glycoside hydrolase n=1 Tax=Microbacterium sp. NPDC089695 TaxID=3364198 RepID=UPI0038263347
MVACAVTLAAVAASADSASDRVMVALPNGTAIVDPSTLEVLFHDPAGRSAIWSGPTPTDLGPRTDVSTSGDGFLWSYPELDLTVFVHVQNDRLMTEVAGGSPTSLVWPVTATDDATRSIEFPNGDGQTVPVDDSFWWSDDSELTGEPWNVSDNLTMPFWGTTFDSSGASYIIHDDLDTTLSFSAPEGRLIASATHAFRPGSGTGDYRVSMSRTSGEPIDAARHYRSWLLEHDGIVTLDEKTDVNPQVERLRGALHGYLWGDGDDPALIRRLEELGITAAWLGYNVDVAGMSADTVDAARDAGFLTGPYDTWENAQDPATSDSYSSIWPGSIWQDACAIGEDGEPLEGFGGRGCTLSSTAMAEQERISGVLSSRVQELSANGVDSYFLDVDATGDLADDYSTAHPQTKEVDRKNRLARMLALSSGRLSGGEPFVLGSEKAEWWANPALSFSHGSSTVLSNGIWALQKDKEQWGGYWPTERPAFFFRPVRLPESLSKEMIDPRYRVPLYQTVLHDALTSTDRWEMGMYKFEGAERTRTLTTLLYNSPPIYALDHDVLDAHGSDIAATQAFFAHIQSVAGTAPLLDFERLTDDVQRTTFGDDDLSPALTLTANFGAGRAYGTPPGCIVADTDADPPKTYCPSAPAD